MFFNTYEPSAALARYVRSYWILEMEHAGGPPETIIPDGCMELIFHYGDAYVSSIGGQQQHQTGAVMIGQIQSAISLEASGKTGICAVRFYPWGLYALTGLQAKEITEQVIPAEDIWGKELTFLTEQLYTASYNEKIKLVEQFLFNTLKKQDRKVQDKAEQLSAILGKLIQHHGNIPVARLAYIANTSVRNFSRSVSDIAGLSPKKLSRIARLQQFLHVYDGNTTLTDSLYRCGYFDQAHFIREFKEIVDTTPTAYFNNDNMMSDLMLQ